MGDEALQKYEDGSVHALSTLMFQGFNASSGNLQTCVPLIIPTVEGYPCH